MKMAPPHIVYSHRDTKLPKAGESFKVSGLLSDISFTSFFVLQDSLNQIRDYEPNCQYNLGIW